MTEWRDGAGATPCRVGIWGAFDQEDYGQAIYTEVVRSELMRRLPDAHLRFFAPYGPDRPTRSDRGEPAEALGVWSPARTAELADQLDFVVVGGADLAIADEDRAAVYGVEAAELASRGSARFFVEGPGPAGPPVRWHVAGPDDAGALRHAGVEGPIDITAHPAVLASRVLPASVLTKRLEYLRLMGWCPREGAGLVLQAGAGSVPLVPALLPALRRALDDHPGLTPVVIELHHGDGLFADALASALHGAGVPAHRTPPSLGLEDVAALIAASAAFVGTSPAGGLTASGYARPWIMGAGPDGLGAALARAMGTGPDEATRRGLQGELDTYLDRLAGHAAEAARSRHPNGLPERTRADLQSELAALRRAHRIRVERSNAERVMLADHVSSAESGRAGMLSELEVLRRLAEEEGAARARFEAECAALHQTRTFRWTARARALYRVLGGPRP